MNYRSHCHFSLPVVLATLFLVALFFIPTTRLVQSSSQFPSDVVTAEALSVDLTPTNTLTLAAHTDAPALVEVTPTPELSVTHEADEVELLPFKNYLALISNAAGSASSMSVESENRPLPPEETPAPTIDSAGSTAATPIDHEIEVAPDLEANALTSPQGSFQIVALHSNKCLDVAGGAGSISNGANVQQWTCLGAGQTNQFWRLVPVGNLFQLVAAHSGKCLDVAGGVGATGNGTNVHQWQCIGASQTNQLWRLVPVGNSFQIIAAHSGKCLDVAGGIGATGNGTNVHQWQCIGASQTNQLWQLIPAGNFQLVARHSSKCLDVTGGTGAIGNGTNVQQWSCLGISQTNQLWRFVRVSNNRFQVVAAHSNKCLDVAGGTGSTTNGANVQQWACLGAGQTNQLWRLAPVGSRFQLIAIHSGKCLDVAGGTGATGNGANVQQWSCLGASQTNQLWELRRP